MTHSDEVIYRTAATGAVHLVAGRRRTDGLLRFPIPYGSESEFDEVQLPDLGVLWSYTVQRFCPKAPYCRSNEGLFKPYAVGYVHFAGLIIIEGLLRSDAFASFRIGMQMRTVETSLLVSEGAELPIYAFEPVAEVLHG